MEISTSTSAAFGCLTIARLLWQNRNKSKRVIAIVAPRGSGKSVLVNKLSQRYHNSNYIFLDLEEHNHTHISLVPEKVQEKLKDNPLQKLRDEKNGIEVASSTQYASSINVFGPTINKTEYLIEYKNKIKELKKNFKKYTIVVFCSSFEVVKFCKIQSFHCITPTSNLFQQMSTIIDAERVLQSDVSRTEILTTSSNTYEYDDYSEMLTLVKNLLKLK